MKHLLWGAIASFAIIVLSAPALHADAQVSTPAASMAPVDASSNVTGDYQLQVTGDRLIVGTLHLTQVGDVIVGSGLASAGGGVLQISGKLVGSKVEGNWRGPTGNVGWVTLNFDPSLTSFNGQWGYGGRNANGSIVAKRVKVTSF